MKKKRFISNSLIIKNQKGLSAIVATLIIILLVLVAVGIIWVVVRSIVQEGAERIELGRFTLDLEIKSVQIGDDDVTVIVVKRNPGEGNFIGMNFIFSDGTNTEIIRENTTLEETEEKSFTFILMEISIDNLKTVSVIPIFELSSGKESIGDIVDSFDVTGEMKAGITGGVVSNFEALGFEGTGREEYSISSQSEDVVKIEKAIVDPVDVLPGDNQTFTVHVYSPYEIIEVTSVTELDNSTSNLIFLKISEYEDDSETIEIWAVTWIVNDVHAITYRTTIVATDAEGNSDSITLTWTDSCQSQIAFSDHGADKNLLTTCTTAASSIGGLDGGNIILGANVDITLASNSQFIFNQGESITITASGASIISTGTGSFGNGELYYTDGDSDGYAPSGTLALSGDIRAKDVSGISDCSDGDGDIYQNVANMILDSDQDRYSIGSAATGCVGAKSSYWYKDADTTYKWISTSDAILTDCNDGDDTRWRNRYYDGDGDLYGSSTPTCVGNHANYVDNAADCCDSDANANGEQTDYFTNPRTTCGGYDYNCDSGVETKQWTEEGGCYECQWDGMCIIINPGSVGYTISPPSCGNSATYVTNPGSSCSGRSEGTCESYCYGASYGARTQACR